MSDPLDSREEDRISGLPWEILNIILRKLTIGDAIRTSVLSQSWRYKWLSLSDFHLDADKFAEILNRKDIYKDIDEDIGEDIVEDLVEDLGEPEFEAKKIGWDVVNSVVNTYLLHHTSSIRSFSVIADCGKHEPDLYQWMQYLSKQPIEALTIEDSSLRVPKIPSHLFSFEKLKSLRLNACALQIPTIYGGFKLLSELYLDDVIISDADLAHLIFSCPVLEYLTLSSIFELSLLSIYAPKLRLLSVGGGFDDIVIEDAPNLSTVRISDYLGDTIDMHSVVHCLSGIGSLLHLDLSEGFMHALADFDGLILRNDAVTSLNLDSVNYRHSINAFQGCLSVLSTCRNIEHFSFFIESGRCSKLINQFLAENQGQYSFTKLTSITLIYKRYACMIPGVEFINFVAAHSPNLKHITIQTEGKVKFDHFGATFMFSLFSRISAGCPHALVSYRHVVEPNRPERI